MECEKFYDNSLPIFVFILIGLLLGIIIVILIWCFCIKSCLRDKRTVGVSENFSNTQLISGSPKKNKNYNFDSKKILRLNTYDRETENSVHVKKFLFIDNFDWRRNKMYFGSLDRFDMKDLFSSDISIHQKDIRSYYDIDFKYMNDRVANHMHLLEQLINFLAVNKLISDEEYKRLSNENSEEYKKEIMMFNEFCQEFVLNIRKSFPTKLKNEEEKELDIEMKIIEELPSKADIMINQIVHSISSRARLIIQNAKSRSSISENDANEIMKMYSHHSQTLEDYLSQLKQNSQMKMEERLKNINLRLKATVIDDNLNNEVFEKRKVLISENTLPRFHNLSQSEKEKILKEYNQSANDIKNRNREELLRQKEKLMFKINERRKNELDKAFNEKENELNKINKISMKTPLNERGNLMNAYKQVVENLDNEVSKVLMIIDEKEMEEYNQIKNRTDKAINTELDELETQIIQTNCEKLLINPNSADMIIANHQRNVIETKKNMDKEKRKQIEKLDQILKKRKQKNSTELEIGIQGQIEEELKQENIFKMTMENQLNIPQDLKQNILDESKADAIAINNQLKSVKIRQQKQMELALAKRLQDKANTDKKSNSITPLSGVNEIEKYENLLKLSEKENSRIILETRDRMVNETKAGLKQQEEYMANVMAKYMVSHARKLKKKKDLDNLYQNLLTEMNKKMTKSLSATQIIDKFKNEKDSIEKQRANILDKQKEQFEKALQERQRAKESELQKHYLNQLDEFEKNGASKEYLDFVDARFTDEIVMKLKQDVLEGRENLKENFDTNDFDNALYSKTIEALSRLVDISEMSKEDMLNLIKTISPNIDNVTKDQVVREIFRKQSRDSISVPQYNLKAQKEEDFFQKKDNEYNEPANNNYDEVDNSLKRNKSKKKKKRSKSELISSENDDEEF